MDLVFLNMCVCLLLVIKTWGKQGLSKWFLVSEVKETVTHKHDDICQRVKTELSMGDHRVWTKTAAKRLSDQLVAHETRAR